MTTKDGDLRSRLIKIGILRRMIGLGEIPKGHKARLAYRKIREHQARVADHLSPFPTDWIFGKKK